MIDKLIIDQIEQQTLDKNVAVLLSGGVDSISASTYANFDDVIYAATGFTWSLNNNGHLIATL